MLITNVIFVKDDVTTYMNFLVMRIKYTVGFALYVIAQKETRFGFAV